MHFDLQVCSILLDHIESEGEGELIFTDPLNLITEAVQ